MPTEREIASRIAERLKADPSDEKAISEAIEFVEDIARSKPSQNEGKEANIGGYVLVNDSSHRFSDGRYVAGHEPIVFDEKEDALRERDDLREEHDNPDINAYSISSESL